MEVECEHLKEKSTLSETDDLSRYRVVSKICVFNVNLSTLLMNFDRTEAELSHLCKPDVVGHSHAIAADFWTNDLGFVAFFDFK